MKCIITGHTKGIGKFLYNHFSEKYDVLGISRTTGYDLNTDISKIVELSKNCDLFINCAAVGNAQLELLNNLHNKESKMIVFGSIAGNFHKQLKTSYSENKFELSNRCFDLSLLPNNKILHLNVSMLEDAINGDNLIKYSEIVNAIEFWLVNPNFSNLTFEFKLTPFVLEKAKDVFGISQENLNIIMANMCDEKKQFL